MCKKREMKVNLPKIKCRHEWKIKWTVSLELFVMQTKTLKKTFKEAQIVCI